MENEKKYIGKSKNIFDLAMEVCEYAGIDINEIIAISTIYRHKKNRNPKKNDFTIKGLNIQLYGHELIIIPNVRELKTMFHYVTNDNKARSVIAYDLINNKNFSKEDTAKLMKCSLKSVEYLLTQVPEEVTSV